MSGVIALGAHGGFVAAAYAVTALVFGTLVLAAVLDGRAQRRALRTLEARGIKRRSASP